MATWSALSGGIWDSGRRVVAGRCRQRWRVFRRFRTFLLRLDAIGHRPLQGSHSSLTCPACPCHRLAKVGHGLHGRPRTRQSPSSCRDDTLGHAAKAHPPLLADTRRRIVYCRGIPYGERLQASRESAPWQRRNAKHGVNCPSRPSPRVVRSLRPLMPWCTPHTPSPMNHWKSPHSTDFSGGVCHHSLKAPEVRIWTLRNQSRVGTVPPSTSTPHCPAC